MSNTLLVCARMEDWFGYGLENNDDDWEAFGYVPGEWDWYRTETFDRIVVVSWPEADDIREILEHQPGVPWYDTEGEPIHLVSPADGTYAGVLCYLGSASDFDHVPDMYQDEILLVPLEDRPDSWPREPFVWFRDLEYWTPEPKPLTFGTVKIDIGDMVFTESHDPRPLRPGDVVRLKSGGPAMTVDGIHGRDVTTLWFDGGEVCSRSFPVAMLEVVQ